MSQIAVVSDTHCYHDPADAVPAWVTERLVAADHVVHAGDFVTADALAYFDSLASDGDLVAVRGNADVAGVDLPEVAMLVVGGVAIGVTHPLGVGDASLDPTGYERAVVKAVREQFGADAGAGTPDVAVAGHTHRVIDRVVDGIRLLNPGSATGALPAEEATMLVLEATDGEIEVTALDRHGPR